MANRTEEIFLIDVGQYIINAKKIRYVRLRNDGMVEIHLDRGDIIEFVDDSQELRRNGKPTLWEQLNAFNPCKWGMSNE